MDAKRCDRCGSYYEKNEKKILEVTEQDRIKLEFEKCIPIKGKDCTKILIVPVDQVGLGGKGFYKDIDLCDECVGKLMRFIKNEADILVGVENNETDEQSGNS